MARKCKIGLTYFSHDCDSSSDPKLKIIIAKYGVVGYGTYWKILEDGYKEKGYYYDCTEDNIILLSSELKLDTDKVQELINFMVEKNCFNKKLYEQFNILTSTRMQKNYIAGSEQRIKIEVDSRHLLINIASEKTRKSAFEVHYTDLLTIETVGNGKKTVGKPLKKKERKEKGKEKESIPENSIPDSVKIDLQNIVDKWNKFAILNKLTVCQKLYDDRKFNLYERYKESEFDIDKILKEIKDSSFLLGKKKNSSFKIDFDWIIKDDINYTKILEGKYRGESAPEKPNIETLAIEMFETRKGTLVAGYNNCIKSKCFDPVKELASGMISRLPDDKDFNFRKLQSKLETMIKEHLRPQIKKLESPDIWSADESFNKNFNQIQLQ